MILRIQGIDRRLQTQYGLAASPVAYKNINQQSTVSMPFDTLSLTSQINNPKNRINAIRNAELNNLYVSEIQKVFRITPEIKNLPDFSKTLFKIGLVVDQKQADFNMQNGKLFIETSEGKQEIANLENLKFIVKNENNSLAVYKDNKLIGNYQGKLIVDPAPDIPVIINGKKYRGGMEIITNPFNPNTLNVINTVMLEDYLKGVVPAESSSTWPQESLKAQAIAARTYAIANWRKQYASGFDLTATTADQVYKGMDVETPSTNKAVEDTKAKVIFYNEKPINALFHACSGGHTDSSREVWGLDLPYIQGVPDFDQSAPKYKWTKSFTNSSIQNALKQLGIQIGDVKEITPKTFTEFGRVKEIEFIGTNGTTLVNSNKFRFALGLNSTLWTVQPSDDKKISFNKWLQPLVRIPKSFIFNGSGWGHGLGMSQWGARQMALDGKTAEEILKHYYTGVEVNHLFL